MEENKDIVEVSDVKIERHKWPDEVKRERKVRKSKFTTFVIVALVFFLIGFSSSQYLLPGGSNSDISKFSEIEHILTSKWYFGRDIEDLETIIKDNGLYGMSDVSFIDPHTTYLSKEEIMRYTEGLSGTYVGIGVQYYATETGSLLVDRVFNDSPASKGGMMAGDIMLEVDGISLEGISTDEVSSMVRGEPGTKVEILVQRDNDTLLIEMVREKVIHSSFAEELGNGVGYIELEQFGETTAEEVGKYLADFKDVNKLVIDLRNNGGGYLTSVVDITSYFMDKDEIVLIAEDKAGNKSYEHTKDFPVYEFEEIVILVNGGTASASEVLTAALQVHLDNVTVVGTKTYGKGTVQQTQFLSDGSALKYTTAEWFAPDGGKIHGVGILPDEEIKLHEILNSGFNEFPENSEFSLDQIGQPVQVVQRALDFLGYKVARTDGYFDSSTQAAVKLMQKDLGMSENGIIDEAFYSAITSRTLRFWTENQSEYDLQKIHALQMLGIY